MSEFNIPTNEKEMKQRIQTKTVYTSLLVNQYNNNKESFLTDIKNNEHVFWGCCRDFAKQILFTNKKWAYLSYRVDDYGVIVEENVINKMDTWLKGRKDLDTLEKVIKWLFDRYVNTFKNVVDKRYKFSIDINDLISLDQLEYMNYTFDIDGYIALEQFLNCNEFEKIEILKVVWEQNFFDLNFDIEDIRYLCKKYNVSPLESFLDLSYTQEYEREQSENRHSQLVFIL
jgi:hypothetical protein